MRALSCVDALAPGPGSRLLIMGATGGIGTYAIQMAVFRGARVLATARPDATDYVTSLGAAEAFDYTHGDLVAAVRALYAGGMDAVLDLTTTDSARLAYVSQVLREGCKLLSTIESAHRKSFTPTSRGRQSTVSIEPSTRGSMALS